MTEPPDTPNVTPERQQLLNRLPRQPGVYVFKDNQGAVFYVGKANNLYSRVRSYFSRAGSDNRPFVALLGRLLSGIDTIVTANEKEALLLENTLIKQHHPRFNIRLRDDKNYLVLRIDTQHPFPRVEVVRRIKPDGAHYFGPYHSAAACREMLRLANRYFRLRTCTDRTLDVRSRPCLEYQIGRCPAPCVFDIDQGTYAQQIEDVSLFLRGRREQLANQLAERMQKASDDLDFERAAELRDQLSAVRRSLEQQEVVTGDSVDQDAFGYYREGDLIEVAVLKLRRGVLVGQELYSLTGLELPDNEVLSATVTRYYDRLADGRLAEIPHQVLTSVALKDAEAQADALAEIALHRVELAVPQRGRRRKLVELATRNAEASFRSRRHDDDSVRWLDRLQQKLHLKNVPRHVECFDISGYLGRFVVASMTVTRDGKPDSASYRHFKISFERNDDFAAMYQVLARRFHRAITEDSGWELPDLIVIDGGKGQLSMALAAYRDAGFAEGVNPPDIVALAKDKIGDDAGGRPSEPDRVPDRVFVPHVKDPFPLHSHSPELFQLARIRDEAHRFALQYYQRLRRSSMLRSGLDDVPGIGPTRKRQLLRHFGSVKRLKEASVDELRAVPSMSLRAAEAVVDYLGSGSDSLESGSTSLENVVTNLELPVD